MGELPVRVNQPTDTEWRDIGHGHSISFRYANLRCIALDKTETIRPILAGLLDRHSRPDGTDCRGGLGGWIPFANAEEPFAAKAHGWTVENWDLDRFTLSPSLLCQCGDHGFIREGLWVPA